VFFSLLDAVELGSLRWAKLLGSLERLVRAMRRTPLRLHPLIVVELLQLLREA
jgi:hypothetical protein